MSATTSKVSPIGDTSRGRKKRPPVETPDGLRRANYVDKHRMFTKSEARQATDDVKREASQLWKHLAELHAHQAHKALGYSSWAVYCLCEFRIGKSQSYRLIKAAEVRSLVMGLDASGGDFSESQLRELEKASDPAKVWRSAVKKYGDKPTAAQLKCEVEGVEWEPKPKPDPDEPDEDEPETDPDEEPEPEPEPDDDDEDEPEPAPKAEPKSKSKPRHKPKAEAAPKPAPAPKDKYTYEQPPERWYHPSSLDVSYIRGMRDEAIAMLRKLCPEDVWRLDQPVAQPGQVGQDVLIELDRAALELSFTVSYLTAQLLRPDQPESWGPKPKELEEREAREAGER